MTLTTFKTLGIISIAVTLLYMSESVAVLTGRLADIDASIAKAQLAQSMGSDGTNLQNALLATLYKERKDVVREIKIASADPTVGESGIFGRTRVTGLGNNYP